MVKAYTLSDKIVQQGFNDFESVVGNVYKRPNGGAIELSSIEALRASGATQISIGQIVSYYNTEGTTYNTYTTTSDLISSNILDRLFGEGWSGERSPDICDQWVVIRRFESTAIIIPSAIDAYPSGIAYKIVADCYLSVVEP